LGKNHRKNKAGIDDDFSAKNGEIWRAGRGDRIFNQKI
jgi:hypothetical protein